MSENKENSASELKTLMLTIECESLKNKIKRRMKECQILEAEINGYKMYYEQEVIAKNKVVQALNDAYQEICSEKMLYLHQVKELEHRYSDLLIEKDLFAEAHNRMLKFRNLKAELESKLLNAANCSAETIDLSEQLSETERKLVVQRQKHDQELQDCEHTTLKYIERITQDVTTKSDELKCTQLDNFSQLLSHKFVLNDEQSLSAYLKDMTELQLRLQQYNELLNQNIASLICDIKSIKDSVKELSSFVVSTEKITLEED